MATDVALPKVVTADGTVRAAVVAQDVVGVSVSTTWAFPRSCHWSTPRAVAVTVAITADDDGMETGPVSG